MAYATESEVRTFYAGQGADALEVSVTMNVAARTVQEIAPAPTTVTSNYQSAARDAELLVGRYISSTQGGLLTSVSGDAGSLSFANREAVVSLVRGAMVGFALSGGTPAVLTIDSQFADEEISYTD